jgi:hypothetical protein
MKYLNADTAHMDMDSGEDTQESLALLENQVAGLRERLAALAPDAGPETRAAVLTEIGGALIRLEKHEEAWAAAREAFELCLAVDAWEPAIRALEAMFQCEQPQSLAALGQAIWLAVTFPVDPELTVAMLQHVIDETPPDADGAAVAATVAHYVADMRMAPGKERDNLLFYTNQMLATVARRHSDIQDQAAFDAWFKRLELDDPAKFLVRLRNIVDVLVQDNWWIDRDAVHAKLPNE